MSGGEEVVLEVTDNGRGVGEISRSSGLANMERRAKDLGGSFTLTSAPGGGTSLRGAPRQPQRGQRRRIRSIETRSAPGNVRILLTDGSGLTARQTANRLWAAGHQVEALAPDPLCLCRFTRHVHRIRRVPAYGPDPLS